MSQGDLWEEAGFVKRRLPPGGCHNCICMPGILSMAYYKKNPNKSPLESEDSQIQNLLSPSRISGAAAIKQKEIFGVKLVAIFQIFISAGLMKMH